MSLHFLNLNKNINIPLSNSVNKYDNKNRGIFSSDFVTKFINNNNNNKINRYYDEEAFLNNFFDNKNNKQQLFKQKLNLEENLSNLKTNKKNDANVILNRNIENRPIIKMGSNLSSSPLRSSDNTLKINQQPIYEVNQQSSNSLKESKSKSINYRFINKKTASTKTFHHKKSNSVMLNSLRNNSKIFSRNPERRINLKEIKEQLRQEYNSVGASALNDNNLKINNQNDDDDSSMQILRNDFLNQLLMSKSRESRTNNTSMQVTNPNKQEYNNNYPISGIKKSSNSSKDLNNNPADSIIQTGKEIGKFSIDNLSHTNSIRLEINSTANEQINILRKKIPILLQNLSYESHFGNVEDKKDFIKNKYKNFLENFDK